MYAVYILASAKHGTLYIGVTNSIRQRLDLHRSGHGSEFVKKHGIHRLVYLEEHQSPQDAIRREKQLKKWNRDWKIVQHFRLEVLPWGGVISSFPLKTDVGLPGFLPMAARSGKSRQLWIARHQRFLGN